MDKKEYTIEETLERVLSHYENNEIVNERAFISGLYDNVRNEIKYATGNILNYTLLMKLTGLIVFMKNIENKDATKDEEYINHMKSNLLEAKEYKLILKELKKVIGKSSFEEIFLNIEVFWCLPLYIHEVIYISFLKFQNHSDIWGEEYDTELLFNTGPISLEANAELIKAKEFIENNYQRVLTK